MTNPGALHWPEVSKEADYSIHRIQWRGMLAKCKPAIDAGVVISPTSKDLGWLIVHTLLTAMEEATSKMNGIPDEKEGWDNVTSQAMRGMFGYLLSVLASGVQPMSSLWQLAKPMSNLDIAPEDEWPVLERMIKVCVGMRDPF